MTRNETNCMSKPDTSWWDYHSDQPYKLAASQKPRLRGAQLLEYSRIAATAALMLPAVLWRYARARPQLPRPDTKPFVGLGVSPAPNHNAQILEMVDELGVQELLLRVPAWDLDHIDRYLEFARQFPDQRFLISILQNRASVTNPDRWQYHLETIFNSFKTVTRDFQIGNAINRSKWGCTHTGEYLDLLERAEAVRRDHPGIRLIGSSVIDFEPLVTLRTLMNFRRYRLHGCASLMYVNRRGSPFNGQYRYFDLANKLRVVAAILSLSNRSQERLWITETNWPLLNTKPWTPNSGHPRSTVDEPTQAKYLTEYYQIAYQTGLVERVYWWQLINPGYGLVDHRDGKLRKHPSYYAFKDILDGGLSGNP